MEIINDEYWLNYGKQGVINSVTARNEGALKLQNMVLWFWGLYTASFTIGVSINAIDAPAWVLGFLGLPIITLIITYWLCVWTQLPIVSTFDPRIPYEIKSGYNRTVKEKNKRFNLALAGTLISSTILAFALFSLSFVEKKNSTSISPFLNESKDVLSVSGTLPKNTMVTTTLDTLNGSKHKVQFYYNVFKVQDNGVFNLNVPLKTSSKSIIISVTWKEGSIDKGFTQTLTK
ncbi:MAG: hypothetical protein WC716_11090 [Chitinophagaceae bacterium]|jgi:hypothetical protein